MTLPGHVRDQVEGALREVGLASGIVSGTPVAGGCMSNGVRLDTSEGTSFFLKWNPAAPAGLFAAESAGLSALRAADAVRVPEPLAWSDDGSEPAWLLTEYIAPGSASPDSDELLGRGLATIHASANVTARLSAATPASAATPGQALGFGWEHDNWIGTLPQSNGIEASWAVFWRDRRIVPQLRLARLANHLNDPELDRLVDLIGVALDDVETPALLHGDLWSGNAYFAGDGQPVLVDPAVSRGDGEVDLAMAELFGGFGPSFFEAYDEMRPISPAYRRYRRDLYQLYYLLVHVNLFGTAYAAGARRAAARVVAEVG
jgi:fructosamine-3-kinase